MNKEPKSYDSRPIVSRECFFLSTFMWLFVLYILAWGQESWNTNLQARLNQAAQDSIKTNRTIVVQEPAGKYEVTNLYISGHTVLVFGSGEPREGDLVCVSTNGEPVITIQGNGYGVGLKGVQLRSDIQDLVGIEIRKTNNPQLENIRVAFTGQDTQGLIVNGPESLSVSNCEFRASVSINYIKGDNINFHNLDLGANNKVVNLPSTIIHLQGQVHQLSFDGYQTWQGGEHAVYGVIDSPSSGQNLTFENVRWEGSTSKNDPSKYAIQVTTTRSPFENLTLIGCRWTDRQAGIQYNTNPSYFKPKITTMGCYTPGKNQ